MKTKVCFRCGKNKILSEFGKDKSRKNNHYPICKQCMEEYDKNSYLKNREKILKQQKIHYQEHKEEIKKRTKKYQRKYKQKLKNQQTKYKRERRRTDPIFKLIDNTRRRINIGLKSNTKSVSTMSLIGCDFEYLAYHLQCQFKKSMTWDNYGDWHVDHIIPCSSFDLSKKKEQRKCFNYTNLQPLWAKENWSKSSKIV